MQELWLIGIYLSHFSNHTWHDALRGKVVRWWDKEAPWGQRTPPTLYFPIPSSDVEPGGRKKKKKQLKNSWRTLLCLSLSNWDKSPTVSGRASFSASLFFMSNLASSVKECEECARFAEWSSVVQHFIATSKQHRIISASGYWIKQDNTPNAM